MAPHVMMTAGAINVRFKVDIKSHRILTIKTMTTFLDFISPLPDELCLEITRWTRIIAGYEEETKTIRGLLRIYFSHMMIFSSVILG